MSRANVKIKGRVRPKYVAMCRLSKFLYSELAEGMTLRSQSRYPFPLLLITKRGIQDKVD